MSVIARIAPARVPKPLSVLIVDPDLESGLALVHSFRQGGVQAELTRTFVNSVSRIGRERFPVLVVRDRGQLTSRELSSLSSLPSTRVCVVLSDPGSKLFDAVKSGGLDAQLVPSSLAWSDLFSVVRRSLKLKGSRRTQPARAPICANSESGAVSGEFQVEWLPTPDPIRPPRYRRVAVSVAPSTASVAQTRRTRQDLPAITDRCG